MNFLQLHKSYDGLGRKICLKILERYGMGPWACHILWIYWDRLWMVSQAGGYYGVAFQVFCGVTQGDPLSPTILNEVVDAVVRHWVAVMVDQVGGQEVHGQQGQHKSYLLYADDGMVASSEPGWLQGNLSTLVRLFNRVGLRKNFKKTVRMVCRPCWEVVTQSEVAYERRMTCAGLSYL